MPQENPLVAFLDRDHPALKARVRTVLAGRGFEHRYDMDRTEHRELIFERCRQLAQHDFGGLLFPHGGRESDAPAFLAVFETLGTSDVNLVVKFGLQFGLFGGAILYLGTKRHHDAYLPRVASMKLVGCYAMTEIGHGSDTRRLQTVARYDRETREFVIHTPVPSARKQFIGNAAMHAEMAVVFAQLEVGGASHGVFGFLVPLRRPDGRMHEGVTIDDTGPKAGLAGVDNGCLALDGVRIPHENLLDRFGTVTDDGSYHSDVEDPTALAQQTMSGGRVAIALASLSAAKTGLAIAVRYAARRRQFGTREERLLLDYPLHRRRLLPRIAELYALDASLKHAAAETARSSAMTEEHFEELAALLKAQSTWAALDTLQECREACGGQGYLARNRIGVLRADIDPMTTLEGDNSLLYMLAAKAQLSRLRDEAGHGSLLAKLAPLVALAKEKASVTVVLRARGSRVLRDAGFALRLLRLRERALLWEAARRLAAGRRGDPSFDYQTPLLQLSRARGERIALERLSSSLAECPKGASDLVTSLRDLYALSRIAHHAGWFSQAGLMRAGCARRVEAMVTALCSKLGPRAVELVDGFGIPDACLGAPIAQSVSIEEK
jgi:acyl-CoA oxidase